MFAGFKQFILRGNVVDLAVGVVVGAAFSNVVNSLVRDIVTPLLGVIGGKPDLSFLNVTLNHHIFQFGDVISSLLSFLISAATIYFLIVLPTNHIIERIQGPKPKRAETKTCPECLSNIPKGALRCPFCTSVLEK